MTDRADCVRKLQELRGDPTVSQGLFDLLESIVARLEGPWEPSEVPTKRESNAGFKAVVVADILKSGHEPPKPGG